MSQQQGGIRSQSAPLLNPTASPIHYNAADDDDRSSVPSTLYARCHATVSRSLNARRLRQAADQDVQFLQNRLNKLKLEEQRAKAEIQQLRSKADEVNQNQTRHSETVNERRTLKDQVDYSKRKEAALIALNKERQAKAVWASKQRLMLDKKESVLSMRKQKEINECRIHILKEEDRDKNTRQRETIRSLHALSKQKREQEGEIKKDQIRQYYEERIELERQEREKKEKLAAQLVAQEAQLIYRLKKLHHEKHGALRGLATIVEAGGSPSSRENSVGRPHTSHSDKLPSIHDGSY